MKNLFGFISRMKMIEERVRKFEDILIKIRQFEEDRGKILLYFLILFYQVL